MTADAKPSASRLTALALIALGCNTPESAPTCPAPTKPGHDVAWFECAHYYARAKTLGCPPEPQLPGLNWVDGCAELTRASFQPSWCFLSVNPCGCLREHGEKK